MEVEITKMKQLMTTKQLEEALQMSRKSIYDLRKEGLPTIVINGKTLRFDYDDVLKWLKEKSAQGDEQ